MDTNKALQDFAERTPDRVQELERTVAHDTLVQAARDVMLYHLDMGWSDHLALMDEVRESIHLRAIARETPLTEFHRIAVREFKDLVNRAVDEAVDTFNTVTVDNEGAHLDDLGLSRPSATWTYMVGDNPLEKKSGRFIQGVTDIFR